jgi:hypothetical protein
MSTDFRQSSPGTGRNKSKEGALRINRKYKQSLSKSGKGSPSLAEKIPSSKLHPLFFYNPSEPPKLHLSATHHHFFPSNRSKPIVFIESSTLGYHWALRAQYFLPSRTNQSICSVIRSVGRTMITTLGICAVLYQEHFRPWLLQ